MEKRTQNEMKSNDGKTHKKEGEKICESGKLVYLKNACDVR